MLKNKETTKIPLLEKLLFPISVDRLCSRHSLLFIYLFRLQVLSVLHWETTATDWIHCSSKTRSCNWSLDSCLRLGFGRFGLNKCHASRRRRESAVKGSWAPHQKFAGSLKLQFLHSTFNKLVELKVYGMDILINQCCIGEISCTVCGFTISSI